VAQCLALAVLGWTTPEALGRVRPFALPLGSASTLSQTFRTGAAGLRAIRFPCAGGQSTSEVRAILVGVAAEDTDILFRFPLAVSVGRDGWCHSEFVPAGSPGGTRFRLELDVRGGPRAEALTLQAVATADSGGLMLNSRALPANLVFEAEGARLDPLTGAGRLPLGLLVVCFLVSDLGVALMVRWLLSA